MIKRFSSKSKVFSVTSSETGCFLKWQVSLNLKVFKYMSVIDFYTNSWPADGKKICHISSNLTESTNCNPDGHIFSWVKKPSMRVKGCNKNTCLNKYIF